MIFSRKATTESAIYRKASRRLEAISSEEILRYVDNTHSALGNTISQLRKSLHGTKTEETLPVLTELCTGIETIKAASDVLLTRHKKV